MTDVRVVVLNVEQSRYDSIVEFKDWLGVYTDQIPDEFLASAIIEVRAGESFGDPVVEWQIYYYRPENAAEIEARSAVETRTKSDKEKKERATLAALKAKYE